MKNAFLLLIGCCLFFLTNCKDQCDDSQCLHEGICESGKCECLVMYSGENCELEVIPSVVKIQTINIQTYEIKPSGEPWDDELGNASKPDIFIKIFDDNNQEFSSTEGFHTSNITQITLSFLVEFTDVTTTYKLVIYDEDGDTDEVIHEFSFQPYIAGLNFPPSISKTYFATNIPPVDNGMLTINWEYCF